MTQPITLAELSPAEFRRAIGRLVGVYAAAMNPPQRMLAGRDSILDRHAANPGFRALIVRTAIAGRSAVAGFTYGFRGAPGQWWHDMVAAALASMYPPSASTWLADSFEVAELHVLPAYQGIGIGRRLLLELTTGRSERTAVLSTQDTESRARRLYRGVGFTDLLTGFRFSGAEPPYAVMGAALPLRAAPSPGTPFPDSTATGRSAGDASRDPAPPRSPRPSSW
jgi:GNAT superfamily N-acetyltransferase